MRLNPWFIAPLLSFVVIESVGILLWDKYGRAIAVTTLLFTFLFFGFFFILLLSSAFGANVYDWVKDVEREEDLCFTRLYFPWLYENKRRNWAFLATLISVILTLVFGSLLLYSEFAYDSLFLGFFTGTSFLLVVAVCWFEGYWKPRTRKSPTEIPESVKAEWADKRL